MEEVIISRKERERNFRKEEIKNAAIRLFAKKGYDHTTLDEIAEASEFGKGTIYNYFKNKEEIYIEILKGVFRHNKKLLIKAFNSTNNFKEFLRLLTYESIVYSIENHNEFMMFVRIKNQAVVSEDFRKSDLIKKNVDELKKIFFDKFSIGLKEGEIRNVNKESLLNLYRSIVMPYISFLLCEKNIDEIDPAEETEFIISIIFNGILLK